MYAQDNYFITKETNPASHQQRANNIKAVSLDNIVTTKIIISKNHGDNNESSIRNTVRDQGGAYINIRPR